MPTTQSFIQDMDVGEKIEEKEVVIFELDMNVPQKDTPLMIAINLFPPSKK